MEDYVNQLVEILDGEKQPVLLVGHSFNGISISQLENQIKKQIE